ncbi:MAG TPA: geranylgeranylglyceryl/heptaprenylglyceryl phosphate synthase [Desulfurococcales archaeon]|nr:geranylgeranylglyceryl/heptaprenylglyceryl phosphate synthase [Desulfurococcales archaeon]
MNLHIGKVERYLLELIEEKGTLHFTLVDPDKTKPYEVSKIGRVIDDAGSDAVLVGGSTGVSESILDDVIKELKLVTSLPIILFPGNITGISRYADAILFISLLNSTNPYFITGVQALGAAIVKKYRLEALPTAYIIIGDGGTAGYIGYARGVPLDKPDIAALYALAAEYMGMRYVYFERGSGAPTPVPIEMVKEARKITEKVKLIVGGGIRSPQQAYELAKAGAHIIVTGTIIEYDISKLKSIVNSIREACRYTTK